MPEPAARPGSCECPGHGEVSDPSACELPRGRWAALVPLLACLLCPACLATYAKVMSFLGIGVSLTEAAHHVILAAAIGLSLLVSGWRARKLRRWGPLVTTVAGCSLVLSSHLLDDHPGLLWGGVAVLLGGGLWEQWVWIRRNRNARRPELRLEGALRSGVESS